MEEAYAKLWKRHFRESQRETAIAEHLIYQVGQRIHFRPDSRGWLESELRRGEVLEVKGLPACPPATGVRRRHGVLSVGRVPDLGRDIHNVERPKDTDCGSDTGCKLLVSRQWLHAV